MFINGVKGFGFEREVNQTLSSITNEKKKFS